MLDPPAPEDEGNIIAALKRSDRVHSISLTLTNSLLRKLSIISEPFSELEELVLLSSDNLQLTIPSAFRWGKCIRTLHVTRIAIPALPQLLPSSMDLIDLQLHEIPMAGYFSPQLLANVLSGASQLRSLSLHFLSYPPRRTLVGLPPPAGHHIVLPVLTSFKYRGISKYLDDFVARIDAPHLEDIDITFFGQPTIDASQLGRFIERVGMNTSLMEADIQATLHAISISFKNSSNSTPFRIQISCKQLDWQLSSMAQVCTTFSPFAFGVQRLVFDTNSWSREQDDVNGEQLLQLFRSFGGARNLSIAGELATGLLRALRPTDEGYTTDTVVLPALRNLCVQKPVPLDWPFWDAAKSLFTSRRLSNHPIELLYVCPDCNITGFTSHGLKEHLVSRHECKLICLYCSDFQVTGAYIKQFQEHLALNHPEVAQNDEYVLQPPASLKTLEWEFITHRHSTLCKKRASSQSQHRTTDW